MVLAHDINVGLRTKDIKVSQDITFSTMLLSEDTLKGLKITGHLKPSPIQLHGIPLGKCGFDLILEAKSGTGKTAVFSVIALEKLDLKKGVQTIILAPTREIAYQIHDVIRQIGVCYKDLIVEVVIGGLPVQDDIEKLKNNNVHIVVGSPGRLKHLVVDKYLDVSSVRLLVLDEADKLLEKQFRSDIDFIFSRLPKQKQVIMSSATYPEDCKEFVNQYVKNAQHVCPDSNCVLLGVEQKVTIVPSNVNIVIQTKKRFEELHKILSQIQFKQCLIFCNYQARVGELYKLLTRNKWPAEQLYGQQGQTERLDALKTLQQYKCRILVSTDLAARGIDASNVDLVVNFEPAYDWETYLHRIGRAGRYGSYGVAVTIISEGNELTKFKREMREIGLTFNMKMFWTSTPFDLETNNNTHPVKIETNNNINNTEKEQTYDELWTVLSNGINQNNIEKNDIESFESLSNSFKTFKETNIESFNDLVKSFKNNVIENTDDGYHLVKVTKLPVPYIVTKQRMQCESFKQNLMKTDNTKIETGPDHNKDLKNSFRMGKYEINDKQGLLDAGLPTDFGGSKYHAPTHKRKINYKDKVEISYTDENYKKYVDLKEKSNVANRDNNIRNRRSESFSSTSSDNTNIDVRYKHFPHTSKYEAGNENHSSIRTVSNSVHLDRLHQFDVWYSQLKAQSKLIEQMAYFEELSKL